MKAWIIITVLFISIVVSVKAQNVFPANGPVGIGTTSPVTPLDVNGLVRASGFTSSLSVPGDAFTYDGKTVSHYSYSWVSDSWNTNAPTSWLSSFGGIKFFTAGVPRLSINNSGRIGIGTTNPGVMLHLKGLTTDASINLETNNGIAKWQLVSIQSTNNFAVVDAMNATAPLVINKGTPNNTLSLTNNGNVLINMNPQINTAYKLDVGGAARMNKVVVNSDGADFVFDSSYDLKPLSHVESYINQHKHLPEIKSATEMQKEGFDLGANQTKLLQKVEELTLYLIQQNKEIEKQSRLIDILIERQKALENENKYLFKKLNK